MIRSRFAGAVILLIALSTGSAHADAPDCQAAQPLQPGDLKIWPVHERLADDQPGETRSSLMNDFGEFQDIGSVYVHTGIDIRDVWNGSTNEGDLVLVVATGDVWAVPQFAGDYCDSENLCRVYIKSTDRRHIFYYAHLNVRTDADSEVRARLEEASMNDPAADLMINSNKVTAGQKLAGLGAFDGGDHPPALRDLRRLRELRRPQSARPAARSGLQGQAVLRRHPAHHRPDPLRTPGRCHRGHRGQL